MTEAFYRQLSETEFEPTDQVEGAWTSEEQHMAPVSGLLTHALDTHRPREEMQLARIGFEILGQIRRAPVDLDVQVIRPGRTIELLQATARIEGRDVIRADAWRLLRSDTATIAGSDDAPMPRPDTFPQWDCTDLWPGRYIAALQIHRDPQTRPGRGRCWMRTDVQLLADQPTTPTAHFVRLVDTANGIATRVSPEQWVFPNTDLTVHLYRNPVGDWVGFDTTASFGPSGVGLTSSVLHDEQGPVGRCEQILTIRSRE